MKKENIYIVIPAFNEAPVIAGVINELLLSAYTNIVIVNDGSTDSTSKVVSGFPVYLIEHIINRGQGAALATGIEFCLRRENCLAIATFDADGQHRVEDLDKMAEIIDSHDLILGSRFIELNDNSMPSGRKLMLRFAIWFLYFAYGLKLTDAHNGLRMFKKDKAALITPKTDGMLHASEMIYLIKKNKLRFIEIPVNINYTEYSLKKGQRTSGFFELGILTLYHKIILLLFEKD